MADGKDPKVEVLICGRRSVRSNGVNYRPGAKLWIKRSLAKAFEERGFVKILNDPSAVIQAEKEAKKNEAVETAEDEEAETVKMTTKEMRAVLKERGIFCAKRCRADHLRRVYAETVGE